MKHVRAQKINPLISFMWKFRGVRGKKGFGGIIIFQTIDSATK